MDSNLFSNAVLDGIPYMVWTCDGLGQLTYINAFCRTHTGLRLSTGPESTGWNLLLAPADLTSFGESLACAMLAGTAFTSEIRLKFCHAESGYRWHAIRVEPTRGHGRAIGAWVGTAIDIEDRKRAEAALIEREQLYRQERATSMLFQQAVLAPHLPAVAGLAFDAVYEPGHSDAKVGGDWYDAVRLLDGRVLVTIGDVAGSGLKAAVIMGVVRQIMRGIAQLHAEPALMLDAADRALRLEYPDAFVTAWVGVFDMVERTLTYASAGHPPPLLLESLGGVRELDHRTLPIGLRQGHQGHASTIALPQSSTLVLYTDGLIEATHDIVEGSRRLQEAAALLASAAVIDPAAALRQVLLPQEGSPDDVAILVVGIDFGESERQLTRSTYDSGDALAAGRARHGFTASLSARRFSELDIANAEVVFGELCGNVARYAPGPVSIVVDVSGQQLVLHVLDRGIGFSHLSRLPADPFSEQGRGLFIIGSMTTEFTVTPRSGGGSHARAVVVGRFPVSLLRGENLPAASDQIAATVAP